MKAVIVVGPAPATGRAAGSVRRVFLTRSAEGMGRALADHLFGAYDGHLIFYEPMITHAFLMSRPNLCTPIKQPRAWERSGYYPTRYCIRYLESRGEYTVSLEDLVYREGG